MSMQIIREGGLDVDRGADIDAHGGVDKLSSACCLLCSRGVSITRMSKAMRKTKHTRAHVRSSFNSRGELLAPLCALLRHVFFQWRSSESRRYLQDLGSDPPANRQAVLGTT